MTSSEKTMKDFVEWGHNEVFMKEERGPHSKRLRIHIAAWGQEHGTVSIGFGGDELSLSPDQAVALSGLLAMFAQRLKDARHVCGECKTVTWDRLDWKCGEPLPEKTS